MPVRYLQLGEWQTYSSRAKIVDRSGEGVPVGVLRLFPVDHLNRVELEVFDETKERRKTKGSRVCEADHGAEEELV